MAKNDTEIFSKQLLDQLLAGRDPKTVLDSGGLIGDLRKALAERMLNAEMDVHLEQESEAGVANHRNGSSAKTVLTPEAAITRARSSVCITDLMPMSPGIHR
jgi:putative transposase